MNKKNIIFLVLVVVMAMCLYSCEGNNSNEENSKPNLESGTIENPINPKETYIMTLGLGNDSGEVSFVLENIWSGEAAESKMVELGVDDLHTEDGEKLVLAEHTVKVLSGFNSEPFMPDLFLLSRLYESDFTTPLSGSKIEYAKLQGAIENAQLMREGDEITGYTTVRIPEDIMVFYDYFCNTSWIKYELSE